MKDYRRKRIQIISAVTLVLAGIMILSILWTTIRNTTHDETYANQQKEELVAENNKSVLCGDIIDTNGTVIASATKDGNGQKIQYEDPYAYTLFVGLTEGKDSPETYGLYELYQDELYSTVKDEEKGATIQMSIDSSLQKYAYNLLKKQNKRGSAIIMDAKTGAIKACVFTPSVNGNNLPSTWKEDLQKNGGFIKPLLNPAVPGSIYKITTSVGILEEGLENEVIQDKGSVKIGNTTLSNSGGASHGKISLPQGFSSSSNVYFGTMGQKYLKQEKLEDLADCFLIGKNLRLDFGTVSSTFYTNNKKTEFTDIQNAWTAIGQNQVQLTIVNAAMIAQTIANDGVMMKPYAVRSIYHGSGQNKTYEMRTKPQEYKTVTEKTVADRLQQIMKDTGEQYTERLTGKNTIKAGGKEISIGLKTGTGEIGNNKRNSIWITSMAPADDPEYVIAMNIYDSDEAGQSLLGDIISLYQQAMK
ncbi:MAG TPA: hypothetical protein H9754_13035 [Candidatus Anaerostipes avistercoris]|uniref:Penicillin-binding protein transpeptidase domain-containing protein n=1 Tax=Candidatus Anaerostipes avistercoris TaxID=2838462 RepID=A0A9D2PIM5_9FIRM|nr:hypothetical protein [Candidatus Anaerostipes avistercoris]